MDQMGGIANVLSQFRQNVDDSLPPEVRSALFGLLMTLLLVFGDTFRKVFPVIGTSIGNRVKSWSERKQHENVTLETLNQIVQGLRADVDTLKTELNEERRLRREAEDEARTLRDENDTLKYEKIQQDGRIKDLEKRVTDQDIKIQEQDKKIADLESRQNTISNGV